MAGMDAAAMDQSLTQTDEIPDPSRRRWALVACPREYRWVRGEEIIGSA
jgi:hypothetical protein